MATGHLRREDAAPQDKRLPSRPHNREVEDEMIRPPRDDNQPPRPATEPHQPHGKQRSGAQKP